MKLPILTSLCLLAGLAGASGQLPGPGWAPAWSDEFGGPALDAAKWSVSTGARRDAQNVTAAVAVTNGALAITTYTEGGVHKTGFVGSHGKFTEAFGYWEARIRFTSRDGMWSAFWIQSPTINNTGNNPNANGTEIDVVEHRHKDSGGTTINNRAAINVHWDGYGADHKSVGTTVNNPGGTGLQGNWHIYGLLWEPGINRFYIDGVEVWSQSTAVSHIHQFIYLTSEVQNGSWAGSIPAGGYGALGSASNAKMEVDWVRFHRRAERVGNSQFDHRLGNWSTSGNVSWTSTNGGSGGPGVRVAPTTASGASAEQTVYGLAGGVEYLLTGWGAVGDRAWPDIRLGVKNFGGAQVYQGLASAGFTRANVPFTTGLTNPTARVFAWVPTQWGDCYADDLRLRRKAALMDPGFESGRKDEFWSPYGDTLVHSWSPVRSGSHAFRLNNPNADRGLEQEVVGLTPNTAYRFSGWMRTDNQSLRLGVKDHGAAESSTSRTAYGWTWEKLTHTFTTGNNATLARVFAYIPAASRNSVVDVDDFFLAEPLPAGWTATDIGAVNLEGESGWRGRRWIVRASGTNIWGATDSFRFVATNLTGDGLIQARLCSFETDRSASKFGLMLRATLQPNSPHVHLGWRGDDRMETIRRATAGGASSADLGAVGQRVEWVRIQRTGDVFTTSVSADGMTWTNLGMPQTIAMPTTLFAGLATCANANDNWTEGSAEHLFLGPQPPPVTHTLIARGSVWSYFAPTNAATAPPPTWRTPGFNDAGWLNGPAKIGYGDGDEATAIPTANGRPFTAYFRQRFTVANPAALASLTLALLRDDGAAVYLNGVEVWRDNLPALAQVTYDTGASSTVGGADENTYYTRLLDPSLLLAGTNLLAIEVHQVNTNSSDLGFDAELRATLGHPDADGDGLPDAWELAHLGSLAQTGADDLDQDGCPNATEWKARTDPANRASRLALSARFNAGQQLTLAWPTVPGVTYRLRRSDQLSTWITLPGIFMGHGAELSWTDPAPSPTGQRFYRLLVP